MSYTSFTAQGARVLKACKQNIVQHKSIIVLSKCLQCPLLRNTGLWSKRFLSVPSNMIFMKFNETRINKSYQNNHAHKKSNRIRIASNPSTEHWKFKDKRNIDGNLFSDKLPIKRGNKIDTFKSLKSLKFTSYATFLKKWSHNIFQQNKGLSQEGIWNEIQWEKKKGWGEWKNSGQTFHS